MWWKPSKSIPLDNSNFMKIVNGLVFECPSSIMKKTKNKETFPDGKKYRYCYIPVSARKVSFRERDIESYLLTVILNQIKKPFQKNKAYYNLDNTDDVEANTKRIIEDSTLGDELFELMIFQKRSDMSDCEAIFYYIRNSFAHGSFEIVRKNNTYTYILESSKDGMIKAQMRLKEETLLKYIELKEQSRKKIELLKRQ